jgi:hypothetical protein
MQAIWWPAILLLCLSMLQWVRLAWILSMLPFLMLWLTEGGHGDYVEPCIWQNIIQLPMVNHRHLPAYFMCTKLHKSIVQVSCLHEQDYVLH